MSSEISYKEALKALPKETRIVILHLERMIRDASQINFEFMRKELEPYANSRHKTSEQISELEKKIDKYYNEVDNTLRSFDDFSDHMEKLEQWTKRAGNKIYGSVKTMFRVIYIGRYTMSCVPGSGIVITKAREPPYLPIGVFTSPFRHPTRVSEDEEGIKKACDVYTRAIKEPLIVLVFSFGYYLIDYAKNEKTYKAFIGQGNEDNKELGLEQEITDVWHFNEVEGKLGFLTGTNSYDILNEPDLTLMSFIINDLILWKFKIPRDHVEEIKSIMPEEANHD